MPRQEHPRLLGSQGRVCGCPCELHRRHGHQNGCWSPHKHSSIHILVLCRGPLTCSSGRPIAFVRTRAHASSQVGARTTASPCFFQAQRQKADAPRIMPGYARVGSGWCTPRHLRNAANHWATRCAGHTLLTNVHRQRVLPAHTDGPGHHAAALHGPVVRAGTGRSDRPRGPEVGTEYKLRHLPCTGNTRSGAAHARKSLAESSPEPLRQVARLTLRAKCRFAPAQASLQWHAVARMRRWHARCPLLAAASP